MYEMIISLDEEAELPFDYLATLKIVKVIRAPQIVIFCVYRSGELILFIR